MGPSLGPDEARKLLGGYATGTLTPEEVRALFMAALEDQKLFDDLAREQELKEVLEDPGVRADLLAATEQAKKRWPWWAIPAASAAALAAITVVFVVLMIPHKVDPTIQARLETAPPFSSERRAEADQPVTPEERRQASGPLKDAATQAKARLGPLSKTELGRPAALPPPEVKAKMEPPAQSPGGSVIGSGAVGGVPGGAPARAAVDRPEIEPGPQVLPASPSGQQQQERTMAATAFREDRSSAQVSAAQQLFEARSLASPGFDISAMKAKTAAPAARASMGPMTAALGLHHSVATQGAQVSVTLESNADGFIYLFRGEGNSWVPVGEKRRVKAREPITIERLAPGTVTILLSRSEINDISSAAVERMRISTKPSRLSSADYVVDAMADANDVVAATVTLPAIAQPRP